jgi:hypothetical protein
LLSKSLDKPKLRAKLPGSTGRLEWLQAADALMIPSKNKPNDLAFVFKITSN